MNEARIVFILFVYEVEHAWPETSYIKAWFLDIRPLWIKRFCVIAADTWWRHQIEKKSALLVLCAENSPVTGEFPTQRPLTRSFDVFFDLRLNKRLSKHSRDRWYETPSHPFSYDVTVINKQRVLMHGHQGWNVRHGLCHIYMIYAYIWVVYSFCLFCCLFIIVTTQFVALYKPCKPKPKPSTYDPPDNHPLAEIQRPILRPEPKQQICHQHANTDHFGK